jgi:hypothetical protein
LCSRPLGKLIEQVGGTFRISAAEELTEGLPDRVDLVLRLRDLVGERATELGTVQGRPEPLHLRVHTVRSLYLRAFRRGAPRQIRTAAPASGGQCSIP